MKLKGKLVDPDGGINIAKKKDQLGLYENISPESLKGFPSEGYTDELSDVHVDYNMIWKFMVQNVAGKGTSTAKPLVKGYNFFKSGHVVKLEKISNLNDDGLCHFRGRILPSMKKTTVYSAFITLREKKVLRAKCACPAGIEGHCNHIAALLFFLEEFCAQNGNNDACTSQPCVWNKPSRKRKVDNVPIHQVNFVKHDHGKTKSVKMGDHQSKDVRAVHQRNLNNTDLYNFRHKLESLANKGQEIGLLHILPRKTTQEVLEDINHDHNYCNFPSRTEITQTCEQHELPGSTQDHTSATPSNIISQGDIISPPKVHPVSFEELKERCGRIKRKLTLNDDQINLIEAETMDQSRTVQSNLKWNEYRKVRITASKCKRVAAMKETTCPKSALEEILQYKQPYQSDLMREGLQKESEIIGEYITEMHRNGHEVTVTKSGFVVSATHGFLGSSPDGLVHDPLESSSDGLVEAKYITVNSGETLRDALLRKGICKLVGGQKMTINRNHQYFYQVHQQMFCTKKCWTDFVVKGGSEIYTERLYFDESFWNNVLPKLERFFNNVMLPELAYPRVKHGLCCLDLKHEL